jgi:16S rRNA processing protein RimM
MSTEERISIGEIVGLHGIRGELKIRLLTDFPERFSHDKEFELAWKDGEKKNKRVVIESTRFHKNHLLIKIRNVANREEAAPFVGALFQIDEKDLMELPPDSYYQFHIIGLEVFSLEGKSLGRLTKILAMPMHDIYVVEGEREHLVPALKRVVKKVDIDAGKIWIDLETLEYSED